MFFLMDAIINIPKILTRLADHWLVTFPIHSIPTHLSFWKQPWFLYSVRPSSYTGTLTASGKNQKSFVHSTDLSILSCSKKKRFEYRELVKRKNLSILSSSHLVKEIIFTLSQSWYSLVGKIVYFVLENWNIKERILFERGS